MAMTWGWFNLITISTYFDIFRQHLSGLNVLQLFFSNARFFEATLVPLSIVHCPSLWVDTPTETYTSALCGHSAVDACVVWWNDCIPETCGAKIENLLRKEAMKTEQTFSAVFSPFFRSGPPVIHPKTSNIRCILGDQSSKFDPSPKPCCIAAQFKSRRSKLQNHPPLPRVSELPLKPFETLNVLH